MQALFRFRWWAAALLLAGGCRSEQAAFSFRPAPAFRHSAPAPAPGNPAPAPAPLIAPAAAASVTPAAAAAPTALHAVRPRPGHAGRVARHSAGRQLVRLIAQRSHHSATAARPARPTDTRDTLHIVLGAVLVVAGVVTGLALGGWLGLGVGAVLVLAGYYFALLGIGGKHAWLEIFQEFFNM
ncbi:hypothetical protein [Hymenobacter rubripertinctus]|uniref:Uncharacterized protein n=1 Tax=Hymenobacter rubripertinctus TaxID=2029981 RepID=A0A418R6C3_9BACT|nr:hypothetical protein [Hymenobacter rubripertinctus]RIY12956.1 hypothetical protein D0T11_04305 [Hymenobacter rubripertinctus]